MLHFCEWHALDPVDSSRRDGRAGLFRSCRVAPNHSSLRSDAAKSTVADSCEYEKPSRQDIFLLLKKRNPESSPFCNRDSFVNNVFISKLVLILLWLILYAGETCY